MDAEEGVAFKRRALAHPRKMGRAARVGYEKQARVAAAPRRAREIAWKAQVRLCKRFRTLSRKGKTSTVVATAIARELAAFIWAIAREVAGAPTARAA
jgi:hypothetical protein